MKNQYQTSELRSKIMKSVKSKNTGAEIYVRKIACSLGYNHYRLNVKTLPGSPDVVFKKLRKVIFVNGCFWHGHDCNKGRLPKSNITFWKNKVVNNIKRDREAYKNIKKMGWKYLVIWQCELKKESHSIRKIKKFLEK